MSELINSYFNHISISSTRYFNCYLKILYIYQKKPYNLYAKIGNSTIPYQLLPNECKKNWAWQKPDKTDHTFNCIYIIQQTQILK